MATTLPRMRSPSSGADRYGSVCRVLGAELDSFVADEEPLDRCLLIQQRDHDVAAFRHGLLPNHDQVLIADAGADHAVTANFQGEAAAGTDGPAVDEDFADDVLLSEDRLSGGDSADDGNGTQL